MWIKRSLFFLGIYFFCMSIGYAVDQPMSVVKKFLQSKQNQTVSQQLPYFSDDIVWHTATKKTFRGKKQVYQFLSYLKAHETADQLVHIQTKKNGIVEVVRNICLDTFPSKTCPRKEFDFVIVNNGKIAAWTGHFYKPSITGEK